MSSRWYKENDPSKPGLVSRLDWMEFAVFITAVVGIFVVYVGWQEYKDGKRVHTELHEEISAIKAVLKMQ